MKNSAGRPVVANGSRAGKNIALRLFQLLLGSLLVGYAVLGPALQFLGASTMGTITEIRRQGGDRGETIRNRYNYSVGYHFLLPDGRKVDGATTVVGSSYNAGIPKGPARVLYFSFMPALNSLEQQASFSLATLILLGAGLFLVRIGVARPVEKTPRKTRK